MSADFGKSVRHPELPMMTEQQIDAMYPGYSHLSNPTYNILVKDYFRCVSKYLNDFYGHEQLEQQLNRRDLDTVCAFELYQMKKHFTTTDMLNMSTFTKHLRN